MLENFPILYIPRNLTSYQRRPAPCGLEGKIFRRLFSAWFLGGLSAEEQNRIITDFVINYYHHHRHYFFVNNINIQKLEICT